MNGWRDATPTDLATIWPAARSAHVFSSHDQLTHFSEEAPWRVRMASDGAALILRRWRGHLDVLAIRIAWGPTWRIHDVVDEARRLAREHGFSQVISPLLAGPALKAYEDAGMCARRQLLAYQVVPGEVDTALAGTAASAASAATGAVPAATSVRLATRADLSALLALDARCFDDFWRYGPPEFADVFAWERVIVAESPQVIFGYATSAISGSSCTLGRLAVDPSARRAGYASALIRDVAAHARSEGALGLSLCTQLENEGSQALYERVGFRRMAGVYAIAVIEA